jgi:hypothetical protein
MKQQDPLERLFRAAAQAPQRTVPREAPFSVESRALASWRSTAVVAAEDWFSFLPIFRRGLALACGIALVALAVSYIELKQPSDEIAIMDSVTTVSYLP